MDYLSHENSYRGEYLLKNREKKDILILGVGVLGSWLLDLLARQGYNNLSALDFDKVEAHNFGTQNYGKVDIGRSKVRQIAQNTMRRIGVKINPIHKKLTVDNAKTLLRNRDLVVDMFDNYESRKIVKETCLELNTSCVHAGMASMGFFQIAWNEGYEVAGTSQLDDGEVLCDYPLASNLVMSCVAALAEVVNIYFDVEKKRNVEFWLGKMIMETRYNETEGSE